MGRKHKMIQVTFYHQDGEWTIHVPAENENEKLAIVVACKCFASDGFDLDDITEVLTERSYSYV
ncbi:hypothetical protein [Cohnella herbarum]|uniref:Uncharacterized protein n=1 Tax=Cohnella herbarum TaxID=2728023 RepID=A0A7Z2VH78_9BACL|nr:hypothetical protein [Cohnella herbarum]QJD82860.1 hypothetical protein HH215_06475 [Cohnella herbarum]